jgi:hypothetical protein
MGKMGKFDATGLLELQKELQKLQKPEAFVESCAKELAARLLGMVVKRTPVGQYPAGFGKVGGTLRRGWTTDGQFAVEHVGQDYIVKLINPVEYASYVEFGHRTSNHKGWVKGQFMMTISEQELEKITPAILEKRIREYLGGIVK